MINITLSNHYTIYFTELRFYRRVKTFKTLVCGTLTTVLIVLNIIIVTNLVFGLGKFNYKL